MPMQVYKNNGLPVGAAVGVPLGAVALAAGLLYLAHLNRKRTARYGMNLCALRVPPRIMDHTHICMSRVRESAFVHRISNHTL